MATNKRHYFMNGVPITKDEAARLLAIGYSSAPTSVIKEFTTRARGYLRANKVASSYTDMQTGVTYSRVGM